ncbi:methylated-DNA-[protein]-cysteine S-methyltransferase [Microbacterium resistens]|uniref:Methylated-DNA-[protein]-cysteine S-methyltransferase n=1 Tax=Microbacterium resistens TaxID=156977 RepID=A0ABU1SH23_9MICO|nr:methylated-DNA--[protein]-cysteine S-methyltransferase [Microbacterium resistens]MDR6868900.1 methylated-DNA-[protein]-cysteine S-methyltransferase [Microbacterium resistens]
MTFRYDFIPTPLGETLAVFSEEGLVAFDLPDAAELTTPWLLEDVSRRLQAIPEFAPGAADELHSLLDAYFEGEPVRFDDEIRFDWRLAEGFTRDALQAICEIPWGETASYGEIAVHAGSPGAARAVGTACRVTPLSIVVPVHRVVRADGSIGQYGAHPEHKRFLIDLEAESAAGRA